MIQKRVPLKEVYNHSGQSNVPPRPRPENQMDDSPSAWGLKKNTTAGYGRPCYVSYLSYLDVSKPQKSCNLVFLPKNLSFLGSFCCRGIKATHLKELPLPNSPNDHPNMDTGTFTSAYDNLTCQKMVQ